MNNINNNEEFTEDNMLVIYDDEEELCWDDEDEENDYFIEEEDYDDKEIYEKIAENLLNKGLSSNSQKHVSAVGVPKKYYSPNSIITNKTYTKNSPVLNNDGPVKLVTENRKRNPISVIVNATPKDETVTIPGTLTEFDRAVHDSVCTIYQQLTSENPKQYLFIVTADQIYRVMVGKEGINVSEKERKAVDRAIEKMANIRISIDYTQDHYKNKDIKSIKHPRQFIVRSYCVPAESVTIQDENGVSFIAYGITCPPMLTYAKVKNQMFSFRSEMLDIKQVTPDGELTSISLKNTEERIAIRSYLLHRIEVMRYNMKKIINNQNTATRKLGKEATASYDLSTRQGRTAAFKNIDTNDSVILLDTLFERCGINVENRDQKHDYCEYIKQALDYWKTQGHITDYKFRRKQKSKQYDAIIITI